MRVTHLVEEDQGLICCRGEDTSYPSDVTAAMVTEKVRLRDVDRTAAVWMTPHQTVSQMAILSVLLQQMPT